MKTVYGPVASWRLGRSLGIDLICQEDKVCSFDCIYCQLGRTKRKIFERQKFVDTERVKKDLNDVLPYVEADVITFSGTGEPTLAGNLGEVIDYACSISSLPIAILTNSSLLGEEDVVENLYKIDIIVAKLDVPNQKLFEKINNPYKGITFEKIVENIKKFRRNYSGKLALQMMFIDDNKKYAPEMVRIAEEIRPDEVQINTPLRPCGVKPLSQEEIKIITHEFRKSRSLENIISVYETKKPKVFPIDLEEVYKRKRPEP
jgi:wyosine [tRNA(Phe)-imidazoG37] synthetase (radical SAM superfamily)